MNQKTFNMINGLKKNAISQKLALIYIALLVFIAIFADFLASGIPIIAKSNGQMRYPVFEKIAGNLGFSGINPDINNEDYWRNADFTFAIWPLVRFSPDRFDAEYYNFSAPGTGSGKFVHYLGTDDLGRDVLSGLIYGSRTAVLVGFSSVAIAVLIGVMLGLLAGFFGDNSFKINLIEIIAFLVILPFAYFYGFYIRTTVLSDAFSHGLPEFMGHFMIGIFIFFFIIFVWMKITGAIFRKVFHITPIKQYYIPLDLIIGRIIELFVSIPKILLIVSVAAFAKPSVALVILIIAFTSWMGIARFVRAEMLKIKNLEFIESARALGYRSYRIVLKEALPNALRSVVVSAAFGVASAIMAEATISFLNIGIPPETVTWGKMLALARSAPTAWWIALSPGILILMTVVSLNIIGDKFNEMER